LNWGGLKKIEPNAAKELGELFVRWGAQTQQLHFAGAEVLLAVLKSYTPSSDMRVDQMWWQLRLDALRVLRMRDDFESVALDFCVVYELSPPCWTDALCVCVHELIVDGDPTSVLDSIQAESAAIGLDGHDVAVFEFKGEILGDAHATLEALDAHFGEADSVIISCALLARVDFSAAGSLLNWTAARQARGCHVQFRDVPRLVAAFFNVIGIDEHASVVLRTR
jgi:ABC-type transporter Mla MlaB component